MRRDLGLLDAVGLGFGAIVGVGIFVVTGVAAGIAGPALRMPCEARLYPDAVPVVGVVSCVVLTLSRAPPVILTGLATLAAGLVFRWPQVARR